MRRSATRAAYVAGTPTHWLATCTVALAISAPVAEAQVIEEHPLTGERVVPVLLRSRDFYPNRAFSSDYAPYIDGRIRILANSYARSASLQGTSDPSSIWRLSLEQCEESRLSRSDYSCTAMSTADQDRIEYAWFTDTTPRQTAYDDTINPLTGTGSVAVPAVSGNSMLNPGTVFRFYTGPTVPYDFNRPWTGLSLGPLRGEDTGFEISSILLSPSEESAPGDPPPELEPHQRILGVLLGSAEGQEDSLYFTLPASQNVQTVAFWSSLPPGAGDFKARVWARCGAKPTRTTFDWLVNFEIQSGTESPAFLVLNAPEDQQYISTCTQGWHIVVENPGQDGTTPDVAFFARWGENYTSYEYTQIHVGIEYSTSGSAEEAWIRQAIREAAWRLYGMSGGAVRLKSFYFDTSGSCTNVDICWRNRPSLAGCQPFSGQYNSVCGDIHVCVDTSSGSGSHDAAADLLAHEFAHQYLGAADEYWSSNIGATICGQQGVTIARCTHSTMSYGWPGIEGFAALCTDVNHDMAPEHRTESSSGGYPLADGLVQGLNTITECFDTSINSAGPGGNSAWYNLNASGIVPNSHPTNLSADTYTFALFADSTFLPTYWDIGYIIN